MDSQDREFVRATVSAAVNALIDADRALAKRVEGLEQMFLGVGYADVYRDEAGVVRVQKPSPPQPKKRSWWRRVMLDYDPPMFG